MKFSKGKLFFASTLMFLLLGMTEPPSAAKAGIRPLALQGRQNCRSYIAGLVSNSKIPSWARGAATNRIHRLVRSGASQQEMTRQFEQALSRYIDNPDWRRELASGAARSAMQARRNAACQ